MKIQIISGPGGAAGSRSSFLATLELTGVRGFGAFKDDQIFAVVNTGPDISEFLTSSCAANCQMQLTLSDLKVKELIPSDPRIERVKDLTKTEFEVLQYLSERHSYPEIAKIRNKSNETIKTQVSSIYMKLDVHDFHEASDLYKAFMLKYPLYTPQKI